MSTQTQHSLEAAERSGDEVRLAEELRKAKPDVAPTVIGILERARSPRVRNAAALALADMHVANARGSLIGALRRVDTRGTAVPSSTRSTSWARTCRSASSPASSPRTPTKPVRRRSGSWPPAGSTATRTPAGWSGCCARP